MTQLELFSSTMYLFFDTETTGLPRNWKAPVTDLDNWPRMVQLAYQLYDGNGGQVEAENFIVKPVGFAIPAQTSAIHGITTERALKEGRDLGAVLRSFQAAVDRADYLVAHNMSFDEKIAGAEFLRAGMRDPLPARKKICTMDASTEFCAIPGPRGYKWPRLQELHGKLFERGFEEAHNAAADVAATVKCFWELKRRGVISV